MSATATVLDNALARAKVGARDAFESIVRQHSGLVFSIAFHFLGSSALAEEISQDIFLELFRNMHKLESEVHLVAWLRRSTANRCIDSSRKHSFRSELPMSDTFDPASSYNPGDPLLSESLRKQVAALPEWQRAVVILRYQEDMDMDEISKTLSIPVNTVKSRLHRALTTLRERFGSEPKGSRGTV